MTTLRGFTGHMSVEGSRAELTVGRGAESWQFFAFVFAALVTLALTLIDELPDRLIYWRIAGKVLAFLVIGYCTLLSSRGRNTLARWLNAFKIDGPLP